MTTSLTETKLLDEYLHNTCDRQDIAVLEVRLMLEPELKQKLHWQQYTHQLVCLYGRKKLRDEIEAVHQKLFTDPDHTGFQKRISAIFQRRR
ncbi:MAG: hypothetical protein EOP56_13970 [Sphingobacteriales bacterium]|nr:MAG: hypothetical protein EOP56_13970 [Sphingobacteriales bacterium]